MCGALAAGLSLTGAAPAQVKIDPEKRATELYQRGNEFYDKSKYAEAETMYRAAWELRQSFEIAGNLGDVEIIQGKPREAAEHLSFAIRVFPESGKPAQKEALRKRLREAASLVGTVNISVNVPGAEVFVDGKSVGKAPLANEIYVDKGDRVIEAKLEGHEPATETVKATAGSTHDVKLALKALPKPKKDVGDGGGGSSSSGSTAKTGLVVGGIIVTTAALATGIGLTVAANGKSTDANGLLDRSQKIPGTCPAKEPVLCGELLSAWEDNDSYTNMAVTSFVVAGIAGAATAATYFLWPTSKKSSRAAALRPVPVVTSTEGGLWLTGTF